MIHPLLLSYFLVVLTLIGTAILALTAINFKMAAMNYEISAVNYEIDTSRAKSQEVG